MAIEVTPDYTGDHASDYMADESNLRIAATATRVFDVVFDEGATCAAALRAPGIPLMYEPYPGEEWLFVNHRDAVRTQPQRCRV